MSKLFGILLRLLFPFDKVGRSREFMRGWLQMVMGWVMDPINIADFEDYPEDRAWLEGHIAATEYGMQVLIWERAREMLGLPFIYHRRQDNPKFRRSKDLRRLVRRLTQLARNFHNLDKLATRVAERMRREHDADPLGLAPAHSAFTLCSADVVVSREVLHRRRRGRWIATPSSRDGGGCASPRGPPSRPIAYCLLPIASVAPRPRSHPRA